MMKRIIPGVAICPVRTGRAAHRFAAAGPCVVLSLLLGIGGCGERNEGAGPAPPDRAGQEAALDAAEAYWRSGDFPRAEAILAVMIERAPDAWQAHEMLSQVLIARSLDASEEGRHAEAARLREEALGHVEVAISLAPEVTGLYQAAGILASMLGRSSDALRFFETALAHEPGHAQAALYAAQMALATGDRVKAKKYVQRTLDLEPEEPHAVATMASILSLEGHHDEAVVWAARAVASAPHESSVRVQHARILRTAGHLRRAAEVFLLLPEAERHRMDLAVEFSGVLMEIDEPLRAARILEGAMRSASGAGQWADCLRVADAYIAAGEGEHARRWLARARQAGAPVADVAARQERLHGDAPGTSQVP